MFLVELFNRKLLKESKVNLTVIPIDQFLQSADDDSEELDEAERFLGATTRVVPPEEMRDYLGRIKDRKKGKTEKYKMPYVHRSSLTALDPEGKEIDLEALKKIITTRPGSLFKKNAKMKHSGGEKAVGPEASAGSMISQNKKMKASGQKSIFVNIGLPALKGLAVDEKTNDFVVVDTCPGAGECKTFCYAMKGGYVQFKGSWQRLSRMLNFLLNDPDGFENMLTTELAGLQKRNKNTLIEVRWHDAGDFFSPEYLNLAIDIAKKFPDMKFYAYTKLANVAKADLPDNFITNFSQGAQPSQEKQIDFTKTKHSKVIPSNYFKDLVARDEEGRLVKDDKDRMQFASKADLDYFKKVMANVYKLDINTIITYDQMMAMPEGKDMKWNVIVMPGDGDESANRRDVLGTYLLIH